MSQTDDILAEINNASEKYGIPQSVLYYQAKRESGFNPSAINKNSGAQGIMQLMPGTAKELGVKDPFNYKESINAGAKYLKKQYDNFGDWELALAAYNAGPGNVRKHGGIPPFKETQNYVKDIIAESKPSLSGNKMNNNEMSDEELLARLSAMESTPREVTGAEKFRAALSGYGRTVPFSDTISGGIQALLKTKGGIGGAVLSPLDFIDRASQERNKFKQSQEYQEQKAPGYAMGGKIPGEIAYALGGENLLSKLPVFAATKGEGALNQVLNLLKAGGRGGISQAAVGQNAELNPENIPMDFALGAGGNVIGEALPMIGRGVKRGATALMGSALGQSPKMAEEAIEKGLPTLAEETLNKTNVPRTIRGYRAIAKEGIGKFEKQLQDILGKLKGKVSVREMAESINSLKSKIAGQAGSAEKIAKLDSLIEGLPKSEAGGALKRLQKVAREGYASAEDLLRSPYNDEVLLDADVANQIKRDIYESLTDSAYHTDANLSLEKKALKKQANSIRKQIENIAQREGQPGVEGINKELRHYGQLNDATTSLLAKEQSVGAMDPRSIINILTGATFGKASGAQGLKALAALLNSRTSSAVMRALGPLIGSQLREPADLGTIEVTP